MSKVLLVFLVAFLACSQATFDTLCKATTVSDSGNSVVPSLIYVSDADDAFVTACRVSNGNLANLMDLWSGLFTAKHTGTWNVALNYESIKVDSTIKVILNVKSGSATAQQIAIFN